MAAGRPANIPSPGEALTSQSAGPPSAILPLRVRDVQLYRVCEDLAEALIYLMVIFTPWAFGTTQPWSIWTMNLGGCFLGLLLAIKMAIRRLKGYRPGRWSEDFLHSATRNSKSLLNPSHLTTALAVLTIA